MLRADPVSLASFFRISFPSFLGTGFSSPFPGTLSCRPVWRGAGGDSPYPLSIGPALLFGDLIEMFGTCPLFESSSDPELGVRPCLDSLPEAIFLPLLPLLPGLTFSLLSPFFLRTPFWLYKIGVRTSSLFFLSQLFNFQPVPFWPVPFSRRS